MTTQTSKMTYQDRLFLLELCIINFFTAVFILWNCYPEALFFQRYLNVSLYVGSRHAYIIGFKPEFAYVKLPENPKKIMSKAKLG